jgi:hypothetical protein
MVARTLIGEPGGCEMIAQQPDAYVFDIDAAVLAARLDGALAAEHGLRTLSQGAAYLTGPSVINDPALACFRVRDVLPLQTRVIAGHLRAHGVGVLEIKARGVDVSPEALRTALKLRGDNAATLLVGRIAGRRRAILAQRASRSGGPNV